MANNSLCSIDGCGKPLRARGFCTTHWARWHKHGDPNHIGVKPLGASCAAAGCADKPRSRWKGGEPYCMKHWLRLYHHDGLELPSPEPLGWATCSVAGCERDSRSATADMCEMHYYRVRRTGKAGKPTPATTVTTHGYVTVRNPAHPVAHNGGDAYLHRIRLYDRIGPGEHHCAWCNCPIEWFADGKRKLVVDHVDGDKRNNDQDNLVASCHRCNANRGLFVSWVMKHRDDPFLAALFDKASS